MGVGQRTGTWLFHVRSWMLKGGGLDQLTKKSRQSIVILADL